MLLDFKDPTLVGDVVRVGRCEIPDELGPRLIKTGRACVAVELPPVPPEAEPAPTVPLPTVERAELQPAEDAEASPGKKRK